MAPIVTRTNLLITHLILDEALHDQLLPGTAQYEVIAVEREAAEHDQYASVSKQSALPELL